MRPSLRALLLAIGELALVLALGGPASAQLMQGGIEISATAGYGGYAFPVANWALGRGMAGFGSLQWQLAGNYSAVPVRVDIYHRQAIALSGRVEVVTTNPHAPAESREEHTGVVSQEFLAPPSTPLTLYLTPRVAPVLDPGAEVDLELRVYQDRQEQPFARQTLRVMQLEPAHVYSLVLDHAEPAILQDPINPGNELQLRFPPEMLEGRNPSELGIRIFDHYLIPLDAADRRQMLGAPLAARDFAFVVADVAAVRGWSAAQQRALEGYVLGGGHLCLYNAAGRWAGDELDVPRQHGRGVLLPVAGGLTEARAAMTRWLEGELEEFTLFLPGQIGPQDSDNRLQLADLGDPNSTFNGQMFLQLYYDAEGLPASHAPHYLHPVWVYREGSRPGAQEPWDYPEFVESFELDEPADIPDDYNPLLNNFNLRQIRTQAEEHKLEPLVAEAQPTRPRGSLPVVLLALALGATLCTGRRLGLVWRAAALSAALALGLTVWLGAGAQQAAPVSFTVVDQDLRSETQVVRTLQAQVTDSTGRFVVPASGLLRYVRDPVTWRWTLPQANAAGSAGPGELVGAGASSYVAVATDAVAPAEPLPVTVAANPLPGGGIRLSIDAGDLAADEFCVLSSSQGENVIRGGTSHVVELPPPPADAWPGKARVLAWQQRYSITAAAIAGRGTGQGGSSGSGSYWNLAPSSDAPLLNMALLEPAELGLADDPLRRLGWIGLLQPLDGVRPRLQHQAVLYAPLSGGREQRFVRLTIPLDAAQ